MMLGIILLLSSLALFFWQRGITGPFGMFLFGLSLLCLLSSVYFFARESLTIAGVISGLVLFAIWATRKGNQANTIKSVRSVFASIKRENPTQSNEELSEILIAQRYRHLKSRLFTEEELLRLLHGIRFDWSSGRQVTFVLGSLIWALENKQYSNEFKERVEFQCDFDSRGVPTKHLTE